MTHETTEASNVRKELIVQLKALVGQGEIEEAIRVAAFAHELNAISRFEHLQILEWLLDIQYEALDRIAVLNTDNGSPADQNRDWRVFKHVPCECMHERGGA